MNVTFLPDGFRAEARGNDNGELFSVPHHLVDRIALAFQQGPCVEGDLEARELFESYAAGWASMRGYAVRVDLDYLHCTLLWLQDTTAVEVAVEVANLLHDHDEDEGLAPDCTPSHDEVVKQMVADGLVFTDE